MKSLTAAKYRFVANLALVVVVLGLTLLSSACKNEDPKQVGPKESVTLGVAEVVMSTPIFIAQAKGYFEEEGLQVLFKRYPSGKKALEGMFAKENEIATTAETPIMFHGFLRNDFCIFATFFQNHNDAKIIARKDRGIRIPADLKGKRVGSTEGTSSHYLAYMYLLEHRIDPASVTISFYPVADLSDALKSGKVDAITAFEPYAYLTRLALPGQTIVLPPSALFRETFNLVVMKAWAGQHPETLKKIIRAVDKAITFVHQNKQETIGILVINTKFSKEMLEAIWDDYAYQMNLDNSMLVGLENEARWAIQNKLVDARTVPNYLDYYYLDAMKAVKPESVSIIK